MLTPHDIIRKTAQASLALSLRDLIQAVQADQGITPLQRTQLINQLQLLAPDSTPLSALIHKGLGGIIGAVIAKYFGMGIIGQLASAAAGFGVGAAIYSKLNAPKPRYSGYTVLG